MENPFVLVYWDEPTLWSAIIAIIFTPLYWMLVSWLEYRTHILRRLFCSCHLAVLLFAFSLIFMLSYRNMRFVMALQYQPKWSTLQENPLLWLGYMLFIIGTYLVIRSFFALGFIASFMGDFFGLCLPQRVTKFPYSWMTHPMYTGSFLMFLGIAIVDTSQAGILLALLAGFMYTLTAFWEEPYTDFFYITCPKRMRTVGVQVSCTSQLVSVPARTVAVQTGAEVDIIQDDVKEHLQVEFEEDHHTDQSDGAKQKDDYKDCSSARDRSSETDLSNDAILLHESQESKQTSDDSGQRQQHTSTEQTSSAT